MAGDDDKSESAWTLVEGESRTRWPGSASAREEAPPETIGRYRVIERLGAGGMGQVYRARDPELDREVAVKIVRKPISGRSDAARERALREAQAMARLSHPNVVEVYDVGLDHGGLFIAMQLIEGPTFSSWRGEDWREVVDKYLAAGEALAAAHAEDLVHRDFKPANVMLDARGMVKVLDFGLVRLASGASSASAAEPEPDAPAGSALDLDLTATGTVLGTPAYMAPETFVGHRVDARADQFSYCVALWEALYGERPYRGANVHELRHAVTKGDVSPPPRNNVPAAVQAVLRRGLRIDAADRYDDMPQLLAALRRAAGSGRSVWVVLGIAVLASAGAAFVWFSSPSEDACGDATAALGATWDEARAHATESAIIASGRAHAASTWEHLRPRVDRWAEEWTTSYEAICRATNVDDTQTPALLDLRMACLERERDKLDAFLAVLGEGSERAVRGAIAAAARLSSPRRCAVADDSHETTPVAERARVAEQRRQLEIAVARRHAGEYDTALKLVLEVLAIAREVGDTALVIDATFEESELRRSLGELHRAERALHDAFLAAIGADDPIRATKAATGLLFVVGIDFGRREESLEWHRHARAQLDRLPQPDLGIEAQLLSTLGAVQGEMGHLEASTASELLALELERQALGNDDVRLVSTLGNATAALINESRYDEAIGLAQEAVEVSESNLGTDHPDVTVALGVLARAAAAGGQHDRAKQAAGRALEIMQANYGAEHLLTARAVVALGAAHADSGDHERALELYRRGTKVLQEELGEDHLELAELHERAADSLRSTGRYAEAADELREGIAIAGRVLREDHPELAHSLGKLAEVSKQAGNVDEAIAFYRRALELQPPSPERPKKSRSAMLHGLAATLREAGRLAEADETYAAAIAEARVTPGPGSSLYVEAIAGRGETLLALGRADEALALLEPVHAELAPATTDPMRSAHAVLVFRLAAAVHATGDRQRARTLAADARERFAAVPDDPRADEVARWLDAH